MHQTLVDFLPLCKALSFYPIKSLIKDLFEDLKCFVLRTMCFKAKQDLWEFEVKVDLSLKALKSSSANKRIFSFCKSFINNGYLHKSKNV